MSAPSSGAAAGTRTVDRPLRLAEDARISALVGFTLAAIGVVLANTEVQPGQNGGVGPMVLGLVLSGVVALAVGILVFSRARRAERAALVVGVLGVLTVVAFWSGLPFVLGVHAVALARRARGRLAASAWVLGGVAIAGAAVASILDRF